MSVAPVSPAQLFVTTLLNPKALVFAFVIFPVGGVATFAESAAVFAALVGAIGTGSDFPRRRPVPVSSGRRDAAPHRPHRVHRALRLRRADREFRRRGAGNADGVTPRSETLQEQSLAPRKEIYGTRGFFGSDVNNVRV